MATNSARVTSAQRAKISLGPVGTVMPVDVTTPLAAAFFDVGLTTPDSLTFTTEVDFNSIAAHQSDYDVRRLQTSASGAFAVSLLEWSAANFQAAYGGGTVSMVSAGVYKFTPPALGARAEFAAVIEIQDNAKIYRYCIPRVIQVEGVEQSFQKGEAAVLPLSLAIQGGDNTDPWWLLSSDQSFAPAS
jgi:hypothetical protein